MRGLALLLAALALTLPAAATAKVRSGPSGVAFYKPPAHLGGAKSHGGLIWERKQTGAGTLAPAAYNDLVLYRSAGVDGKPIAVSGAVAVPRGKPPKGGWPILTWAHGTTGIADVCAPTRAPVAVSYVRRDLGDFLKAGFAVVSTDYQGLGTPGTHMYLVGKEEGRSVLDIVRAARQLDPRLGKRVVIAGHSQGGHAALWAAALAPKWTPELDLEGTIAYAPASHIETQARILIGLSARIPGLTALSALIFRGIDAANPSLHLSNLLTPQAAALYPQTLTQCLGKLAQQSEFGSLSPADLFRAGVPLEPAFKLLGQSDPEHLKIHAPLYIAQGSADNTVIPGFTDQLDSALRAAGTKIDYKKYAGVDHGGIVAAAHQDTLAWARALLR
jgi:pimeloyl-ACP methyl ester carboxylesterase